MQISIKKLFGKRILASLIDEGQLEMRKHWSRISYKYNLGGYGISTCSEFIFSTP